MVQNLAVGKKNTSISYSLTCANLLGPEFIYSLHHEHLFHCCSITDIEIVVLHQAGAKDWLVMAGRFGIKNKKKSAV